MYLTVVPTVNWILVVEIAISTSKYFVQIALEHIDEYTFLHNIDT